MSGNHEVRRRPGLFSRHPWLWVVVAFLVLIGAWAALIRIALEHRPQVIEVDPPPSAR